MYPVNREDLGSPWDDVADSVRRIREALRHCGRSPRQNALDRVLGGGTHQDQHSTGRIRGMA